MNSMFYAYDNDVNLNLDPFQEASSYQDCQPSNTKMLYNKAGKFIGVQTKYKVPFSLYFNLPGLCGRRDLIEFIANSLIVFKINTTTHKVAFEKTFAGYEVLNPLTGDLYITLDAQEASALRQESYRMELSLLNEKDEYLLFNDFGTYLIVR